MFSTIWCMLTVAALGNSICIAHGGERELSRPWPITDASALRGNLATDA